MFWYVISCVIVTAWDGLIESESFGKNSKKNEKAIIISLVIIFTVSVIIMPTIATSFVVMEKTTRQNISMDELLYVWNRITSYNVCYTKLLRFLGLMPELHHSEPGTYRPEEGKGQKGFFRDPPHFLSCFIFIQPVKGKGNCIERSVDNVITSYSIHYTKLYEAEKAG